VGRRSASQGAVSSIAPWICSQSAGLGFEVPAEVKPGFGAYVSDPAKPIPYLPRPIHIDGDEGEKIWQTWLTSDQRPAAARTDVLTFTSAVLDQPLKLGSCQRSDETVV
jgi:predicted acyl esterase